MIQTVIAKKLCELKPGIIIKDKVISECQVKLLTRSQQKAVSHPELPAEQRETLFLAYSIESLGGLTDVTELMLALESLTVVDEIKIRQTLAELEQEYLQRPQEVEEPRWRKISKMTDIVSEPFALNPGIQTPDGKWHKSASVRLIRRGEWKLIQSEPDGQKRSDLILLYSIVQIGDILKVEQSHIDDLIETDVERINQQVEVLRGRYALDTKSAE